MDVAAKMLRDMEPERYDFPKRASIAVGATAANETPNGITKIFRSLLAIRIGSVSPALPVFA